MAPPMEPSRDKQNRADSDDTIRKLEAELMVQRMARQKAGNPYSGFRTASFVFLMVIVLAAVAGYYYVFHLGGLEKARARSQSQPNPSATVGSRTP